MRKVRTSPVADVLAHLQPTPESYSGAGVLSAAQCDRVLVATASALQWHGMQARRPALCSTCPSRALLCVSVCADAAMSSSTVAPPYSVYCDAAAHDAADSSSAFSSQWTRSRDLSAP